jgi:hypothetical protein
MHTLGGAARHRPHCVQSRTIHALGWIATTARREKRPAEMSQTSTSAASRASTSEGQIEARDSRTSGTGLMPSREPFRFTAEPKAPGSKAQFPWRCRSTTALQIPEMPAYLTAYAGQSVTRQDALWHERVRGPNT